MIRNMMIRRGCVPMNRRLCHTLPSFPRGTGKNETVKTRQKNLVPCVVSASNGESEYLHIAVERATLVKEANKRAFFTTLQDIEMEGETLRVLPQKVQVHPVTDVLQHAWFLKYKEGGKVKVKLPIEVSGRDKSAGLRLGGWLMTIRDSIECECSFDNIPDGVPVNVNGMQIGDILRMKAIDWDLLGVKPLRWNANEPIVKVAGSRGARAAGLAAE